MRGCVAFERGPLVYCVESADLPAGAELEDLALGPGAASRSRSPRPDLGDGVVGIDVPVVPRSAGRRRQPCAGAIPYYAWANRGVGGMRVWIPR